MRKEILIIVVLIFLQTLISSENETNSSCTPSWQCTSWSECIGNSQIRVCLDANACGNLSGKPIEEKPCGTECVPSWRCDSWTPATCPDSKTQTRNCTDLNECGTLEGMPESAKSCTKSFAWLVVLIGIIIVILIIGDLGILKEKLWKRKHTPPTTTR